VSQDYNEAVQDPGASFGDADLRAAAPVTNALGLPVPCSGNFADVYQLRHPTTGASWAVKCFTRPSFGRQERYDEISRYLGRARLPFTVDFTYLIDGIRVRGQWFPVVKMQWVEGLLLNHFVRDNLKRPATLEKLITLWARVARWMREAGVAHGDLQHGNVLLVPGSRTTKMAVKLIDYDGLFVPALATRPSGEVGHPAYQHPRRQREATYGPEVDRFPLLVVATALRCLVAAGPRLWKRHDTGDNLLFREADLRAPGESALFQRLWRLDDPLAHVLVGRLALACQEPLDKSPLLGELLTEDLLPVLSPEQQERAEALLGSDGEQVAVPAGYDEPDDHEPLRLPWGISPKPVLIGAAVGLLIVLAAVLLIVWSLAASPRP
jgi:serine/threonine protein kinase